MLTYILKQNDKIPLYEQLYKAIRADILSGVLIGNSKLPSKRQLAIHLKISTVTVETAYAQLVAEGYIWSKPKSGYFIQKITNRQNFPKLKENINEKQAEKTKKYKYDFQTNKVDTDCFPFSAWAKTLREVLTEHDFDLLQAPEPQGVLELRTQICQYLYSFRGITATPEQIVVGAGSEYLIGLLIKLLGRDKTYAIENPGYYRLHKGIIASGAQAIPISLDDNGLCENELYEKNPNIVYMTPSHHFPLGVVMSASRRAKVLEWVSGSNDRYLIEDDYDSEFRYASKPITALKTLDHDDRVIYINTFAKSLAPSLRIGYIVLPMPLVDLFQEKLGFYSSTVPSFEQYTLANFIKTGKLERHIARSRNLYKQRRDALINAIKKSTLNDIIKISGEEAGLHLLFEVDNGMSEQQLIESAIKFDVRVYGLSSYYISDSINPPNSTVLLGYAGMSIDDINKAVQLLEQAW